MKKPILLVLILFVIAGGAYTYVFFSTKKITKASTIPSCCTEVTAASVQNDANPDNCNMVCPSGITTCPSATPTAPVYTPSTNQKTVTEPKTNTEPCDNCVCGTDEECPNEEKCDVCLEEEKQRDGNKAGAGNGKKNGNGQKNRK
ncbi:MAG: hypothetical protein PHD83_03065 [Caldisericia bacterium]|nr:hypothetical protein [Caldisericia bacterium]